VAYAHRKIAIVAMLKRIPAVVKAPTPKRLIFMATAFAPKIVHKNVVKVAAGNGSSPLLRVFSAIDYIFVFELE